MCVGVALVSIQRDVGVLSAFGVEVTVAGSGGDVLVCGVGVGLVRCGFAVALGP